ncbi:MAG TPA: DUF397 domain-containing protein [Streptosporangiaceae bacterium]
MDDLSVTHGTKLDIGQDDPHWRKSSKSNFNGNCVDVATVALCVLVRDSKDPVPILQFNPNVWSTFIESVK